MNLTIATSFVNGAVAMLFLIYGAYFLRISTPNRLKHIFGWSMLLWSVLLSKDVLFVTEYLDHDSTLYKGLMMLDNCAVVTCNIYVIELLRPGRLNWKYILFNFSGFLLLLLLYIAFPSEAIYNANIVFTVLYCTATFVYLTISTIRYYKMVKNSFSDLTRLDISWLWKSVIIMLFNLAFWLYMYTSQDYKFDIWYYLALTVLWSVIAYKTEHQATFTSEEAVAPETIEEQSSTMSGEDNFHFSARLQELIDSAYFCNTPQLTLNELASQLNTNRTTLSIYINKVLGTNFYDMINNSRLEHAEKLLLDSECKLTQEQIAEQSGFNSLSTFRRAFQKKNGMSPAQFRRN